MRHRSLIATLALFLVTGLASRAHAQGTPTYQIEEAFPNLSFRRPVDLQTPRDGTNRLFVVEQDGVIRVFNNSADEKTSGVFLDLQERVNHDGNEMGMLGLTFHPNFKKHPEFYVDYTASKRGRRITRVSRFQVSGYANASTPASEENVIEIGQPYANHNGGQVAFGPDGFLYIAMGDGGSAGDPHGNAQNTASLLGKLLRIDVSKKPYAIPADNPFAKGAGDSRGEIFAYGLRNPWRFSFDRVTHEIWTGDVGQDTWEEIDIVRKGGNYGWDCREGARAFEPANERSDLCRTAKDFVEPVWTYGRSEGISVTGGYVYRGHALPDLVGWYVYGDYGSGKVWALRVENGKAVNRLLVDTNILISTFGVDENDEIYLCAHDPGDGPTKVYKLVAQ